MASEFFHMGITVQDLERSLAFYRDVAGLTVLSITDFDSSAFARLTNNPEATITTALLGSGAFRLQLVHYTAGGGSPVKLGHHLPGSPHLSFWVTGLDTLYARLDQSELATITSPCVEIVPGLRSFYVSDPDGVAVEFIERTED